MELIMALFLILIFCMGIVSLCKWLWSKRQIIFSIICFIVSFAALFIFMVAQQVEPALGIIVGLTGCFIGAWKFARKKYAA